MTPMDPLLPEAIVLVQARPDRASVSLLQRFLHVGYVRAARLLEDARVALTPVLPITPTTPTRSDPHAGPPIRA